MISFAKRRGLEVTVVDELNLKSSFTSHPDKPVHILEHSRSGSWGTLRHR